MTQEHKRQLKLVMKKSLTLYHAFILLRLMAHGFDVIYNVGLIIIVFNLLPINTFNHHTNITLDIAI